MAISKITDEQKETIRNLTSINLPDNPSAAGWRPDAIRAALSKGAGDGAIKVAELVNAAIDEMNEELEDKVEKEQGKALSTNDFTDTLKNKLDGIETQANKTIVDSSLSGSSENPVQNKVVQVALNGKVDKETGKSLSTNDYTTAEKEKLYGIETGANKTIVDSSLSGSSEKPVQNKVVKEALDTLTAESGYSLDFSMDPSTYVLTVTLKNKAGTALSTKTVDLPIEWLLLGASISGNNLILTFRTGENETQTVTTDLSGILSTALAGKVDVVSGKALSTNDFTDTLKNKLDGIEEQANKTVVDDDLSDSSENPVQNKVVKGALDAKANSKGEYDDFIAGTAKQILSTVGVVEKVPYNFRTSAGAHDIGGNRETDKIIGGTVVWNQLVNGVSTTLPTGHIYFSSIGGVSTVAESDGTALTTDPSTDNVHDLTRMFGSTIADYIHSLETTTAGAGVAWFRNLFPKARYSYNAGQLMSVKTSSHDMVGFNQWDEEWELGMLKTNGEKSSSTVQIRTKNYIRVLPNTKYYFSCQSSATGWRSRICFYRNKSTSSFILARGSEDNERITTPAGCNYILFSMLPAYGTTYKDDICINLSWSGSRDGEYKPYVKHSYALDPDLTLNGWFKITTDESHLLYCDGDEYEGSGTVTRKYGIRAYQEGDENDPTLMTDGTDTLAPITPTTEPAAPFANPQIVDDYGTEQYVDGREVEIPVGHETLYQANLRDKLQHLPSLYSNNGVLTDGTYHIQQIGTQMYLVPDTSDARLNALEALVPVFESYTIATSDWTALSSSDPYDYSATVTATHTIGNDTVVKLLNDQPVLFATYGFAIASVSGQTLTIYSIGKPDASVTLEVQFNG